MLISKSSKQFLLHNESLHKLSILIPTSRYNESHDFGKDQIYLRNALKDARVLLSTHMEEREVRKFLAPVKALFEQKDFWKHLSDGLAIYVTSDEMYYFILPRKFTPFTGLSSHFHITPISNFLDDSHKYFILKLDLGGVSFFEATKYSITPVTINDLVPKKIDEIISKNDPEKLLQARTGQATMYHGHNPLIEKRNQFVKQYYRAVDTGIMKMLFDEQAPLILVGLSEQVAMYESVNSYRFLANKHVIGNIDDIMIIQRETRELLSTYLNKELVGALQMIGQAHVTNIANNMQMLPQLAIEGAIDTLVIEDTSPVWGQWESSNLYSKLYEESTQKTECLLNRIVHTVLKNGGKAFTIDKDFRKVVNERPVSAILRYSHSN